MLRVGARRTKVGTAPTVAIGLACPGKACIMVMYMFAWRGYVGFDWDEGNAGKNWSRHGVADFESEEIFFNQPLVVRRDVGHSQGEDRWVALGRTARDRMLFVVFTVRQKSIRVISARDMTRRERKSYEDLERNEETEDYSGV